jgi:hypothetical protein
MGFWHVACRKRLKVKTMPNHRTASNPAFAFGWHISIIVAGSMTRGVGQRGVYDQCKQRLEVAEPIGGLVRTPGGILRCGLSWPRTMDTARHECLLLFRRVRFGFDFCGNCHSGFISGFSGCEEWVPSLGKPGMLGGGPCPASIVVPVLIV